ncbi:MAG: fibronectin type III domain-containing protein [Chloroflexi bacterium]|nr:fibronectin type III domain-containing protein [Chloroflexota bacterium]
MQDPSPDAPFPPPIGLTADFQDSSVILSWDAHPSFTTGWGYKVYYDTDSSLPPYEGTGLNEGDSPIDVGDDTSYTLTGLDPSQDYYFAVTAYDNEGHESWYSNLVQKQGGYWVYLPVVLRQ